MATDGLRRWSANNRLLALLQLQERAQQRPELMDNVHMMSFRQWDKEHGRKVIKGERAIWILAPRTRRVEEEEADAAARPAGRLSLGFTAVPVFNITQTEGPDLPRAPIRSGTGEVPPGVLTGLRDRVATSGYTYREEELADPHPELGTGILGYTDPATKVIVVDPRLSPGLALTRKRAPSRTSWHMFMQVTSMRPQMNTGPTCPHCDDIVAVADLVADNQYSASSPNPSRDPAPQTHHRVNVRYRSIAAHFERPESPVRRWLRSVREQHAGTRAVDRAVTIDRELLVRPAPQATRLGHALNLLAGAAVRFGGWFGRSDPVWSLIGFFAHGRLLAAPRPPLRS